MREIHCNFCKQDKTELLYKSRDRMTKRDDPREFYIHRCRNCGLAYLNPRPEWKELEYFYGGDYYTNVSAGGKRNIFYRALRKIKRAILGAPNPKFWNFGKNKGKFLDVGCGSGVYESYIIGKNPGWEFYGIEPNELSCQLAKNIDGFRLFNGDLKSAKHADNFFDVILMNHSLEHMPEPMEILSECFRILKPGGKLVIAVPNFNCPARRLFGKYWIHLDAPRHLFHFSAGILKLMIEKAGFKTELLNFEILSGSITKSLAYLFNRDKFFFDKPLLMLGVHYLIYPINKLIESFHLASGLRLVAVKD